MTGTWRSAMPKYLAAPSPCLGACPVDGHIAEWIGQIDNDDPKGAWLTLADNNPFPAIAGRICHHPCEDACNRLQLDEPIGICSLERYVGDMALSEGWAFTKPATKRNERIAVVGGGPAGLSCAYQLLRLGFQVTLYETQDQLGGLLRYGIPSYRLEKKILDGEIQRILDLGLDVRLESEVVDSAALQALRSEYDAVYLATGASRPKTLPGLDYTQPWVKDSAEFLAETNNGEPCPLGERLVVIGGGSAAMDVARTARRLGRTVTVLSLEPDELLPAQRIEVDEAKEEDVTFVSGAMLQTVEEKGEGLILNCIRVDFRQGDKRGAFSIDPVAGSEFELEVDAIIPSIGQDADIPRWEEVLENEGPLIRTDNQWRTGLEGVFAGGDVASMERFVTQAIGMGKHAAHAIAKSFEPDHVVHGILEGDEIPYSVINTDYHPQDERRKQANTDVVQRLQTFDEVQQPLARHEAKEEAARCFSCGTCIYCDNCYLYCPDMAITKLERGYEVKTDYCKGCGLCVAECPTGSIMMQDDNI